MDPVQAALAAVCGISFAGVWAGLAVQVVKIARRGRLPPRFHPLLQALHAGRFVGWAWTGAATLAADPVTGWLLIASRTPATALVALTFLQRKSPRPDRRTAVATVLGTFALVGFGAWAAHALSADAQWATRVEQLLTAFLMLCFAAQLLWALPRQILAARQRPLGNLRWFQFALAASYAATFVYSFFVRAEWVQTIMTAVYGIAFAEQALLVFWIERGVRAKRRPQRASPAG